MVRSPNLKEGMRVNFFDLAFLAKIEVRADTALVANALDVCCFTTIASYLHVNLRRLVSGSLPKVVNHQSLEGLSCVRANFLLNNLDKIKIELVRENTGSIAPSAGYASSVDLGAVTLEADHTFIVHVLLLVLRAEDLAVDFLRNCLSLELAALALSLDGPIAECFLDIFLDLGSELLSIDGSVHELLVSLDLEGVAANVLKVNEVVHVSRNFGENLVRLLISANGDAVSPAPD